MAARFRVLITDRAWPDTAIERDVLSRIEAEVVEAASTDEPTLVAAARAIQTSG